MTSQTYALLFGLLVCLGFVSTLVVKLKLIPNKFIYPGLFGLVLLSLFLAISSKPQFSELGLVPITWIDVSLYSLVTFVSCFLINFLNKIAFRLQPPDNIFMASHQKKIAFYIILSAPAQEFLFRSFLYYSLNMIGLLNVLSMVVASCLLFGIAHLGFGDRRLSYGAFIFGGVWGLTYFIAPNLLLISISHATIGFFAFFQGLINQKIFFVEPV